MSAEQAQLRRIDHCPLCKLAAGQVVGLRTSVSMSDSLSRLQSGAALCTRIRWCPQCDFYYPEAALDSTVEEAYGDVDHYFTIPVDARRLAWFETVVREAERHSRSGGRRLLDIGCGRGELVHVASGLGWQAYGVDANPSFVAFARKRFGLTNLIVGDGGRLPFASEVFDVVCLSAVLEHVPDPLEALRRVHRLLRPGGTLYVEVPNESVLRFRAMDAGLRLLGSKHTTHLSPFTPPYHINGFTSRSIRRALREAGFEIASLRLEKGQNRFPGAGSIRRRLIRLAYGAMVAIENLSPNRYNIHAFARRPEAQRQS